MKIFQVGAVTRSLVVIVVMTSIATIKKTVWRSNGFSASVRSSSDVLGDAPRHSPACLLGPLERFREPDGAALARRHDFIGGG